MERRNFILKSSKEDGIDNNVLKDLFLKKINGRLIDIEDEKYVKDRHLVCEYDKISGLYALSLEFNIADPSYNDNYNYNYDSEYDEDEYDDSFYNIDGYYDYENKDDLDLFDTEFYKAYIYDAFHEDTKEGLYRLKPNVEEKIASILKKAFSSAGYTSVKGGSIIGKLTFIINPDRISVTVVFETTSLNGEPIGEGFIYERTKDFSSKAGFLGMSDENAIDLCLEESLRYIVN